MELCGYDERVRSYGLLARFNIRGIPRAAAAFESGSKNMPGRLIWACSKKWPEAHHDPLTPSSLPGVEMAFWVSAHSYC